MYLIVFSFSTDLIPNDMTKTSKPTVMTCEAGSIWLPYTSKSLLYILFFSSNDLQPIAYLIRVQERDSIHVASAPKQKKNI